MAAKLAAHHLHGPARRRGLLADADDAQDGPQADQAGLQPADRLERDRRRRRGQGRAARGRRLPAQPQAFPRDRRPGPEGHPPAWTARDRQDAARQGGRARIGRHVLLTVGGVVRRDVRRPRRRADPAPVQGGTQEVARDRVHRRARRGRRPPRHGHLRRARPDAEPAARRDGRVHRAQGGGRDRRLQPARQARPRAASAGPLRPPDLRLPARRRRPRADPRGPLAQQAARADRRPQAARPPDRRPDRRRPRQHLQRGGDLRRAPRSPRGLDEGLRCERSNASSPACSRRAP